MLRAPVITGLGIVSPIGIGIEHFWSSAIHGRPGIGPLDFDDPRLPPEHCIGGAVRNFNVNDWMGGMFGRMADRFTHFAVAAARMAYEDSGLMHASVPPTQLKASFGSAVGGLVHLHERTFTAFLRGERIVPWMILEYPVHAATSHVTAEIGALGENPSFSTGCCAGLDAIGWAAEQIRRSEALAVIAGGSDAPLSAYAIAAFHASGSLSIWKGPPAQASRPFDRRRSGFVLGEGAAAIVLEEEQFALSRGAKIYARLSGFGSASEGGELRTVDPDGAAAAMAMSRALAQAGRNPEDLDYVCAHGNSMINYDAAETAALKRTLGTHAWNVPISSIKSMCGHPLAAAGPMQVVTAALAIQTGIVPPTINYQYPDPDCDLDYVPNTARRVRIRNALVHAHSIGGTHSAAILSSVDGRQ